WFSARSACRVEPADGSAVACPAERLELIVPRAAKKLLKLLLEDNRAAGAEGERGAELVLRDDDVAVGARRGGEEPEVGRVAVAHGVAAYGCFLGDLEAQPLPAREGGRDRARSA